MLHSDLLGHAGKIQAALIIDIPTRTISGLDVMIEGLNGLQPNLDLVNLVFQITRGEGIQTKLFAEVCIRVYQSHFIDMHFTSNHRK